MTRSGMKKKPVAISDESSSRTYKGLQYLARFAVWIYFRNVKVITRDPPASRQGPVLVAANHMNMVLDPAVLVATFPHGRRCHFWALARFFRIPIVGRVLYAAGVLPVNTQTRSNAKLFEHTLSCLEQGGVVALFPEGTSYTAPQHLPFKDGISWAAYEYLQHCHTADLTIIPVGITYTTKNKWRSDVIVEYGEPIYLTTEDWRDFQDDPKPAVKRLTARITEGVERCTINSPDWDTLYAASEARFLVFGHHIRLEDYVRISQNFLEIFHPSRLEEEETALKRDELLELKNRLISLSKSLRRLHLTAMDISSIISSAEKNGGGGMITLRSAFTRLVSAWVALAIRLPLFMPGVLIHWPIYLLGRLAEHFERHTESVSQDKLVLSAIVGIPLYTALMYQVWKFMEFSLTGLVFAVALIPLFAWYHMALVDKRYDRAKQVVASWRICVAIISSVTGLDAGPRRELEEAMELHCWCSARTKQVLLDLADMGDPHAQYLVNYNRSLFG